MVAGVLACLALAAGLTIGRQFFIANSGPVPVLVATHIFDAVVHFLHRTLYVSLGVFALLAVILWLVGDLFSVVFVMVLMRSLGGYERRRAAQVDAELDAQPATDSTLWWENDPQLKERFAR